MFNKKEEKINVILDDMLKASSKFADGYQKHNIEAIWEEVLGKTIARYTTYIRLDKSVLTVQISSAALKQELQFEKEKLIEKLNLRLNHKKVEKLILK